VASPHQTGNNAPYHRAVALDRFEPVQDEINPDYSWTAGNMMSTIDDLAAWAPLLASGALLTAESHAAQMASRRWEVTTNDEGYGLGVQTIGDVVGHTGEVDGYTTAMMHHPGSDTTIVVLANAANGLTLPAFSLALEFIRELLPDQIRP
jgi:CubicO group peptidase (beta-lactamase class C family)